MALHGLLLHQQLLLLLIISAVTAASQLNLCQSHCGSVKIPYPFGTSWGCYLDESFYINCKNMSGIPKPVLANSDIEVLNISLDNGELLVSTPLTRLCFNNGSSLSQTQSIWSKFPISDRKNKFIAVGCDIFAYVKASVKKEEFLSNSSDLQNLQNRSTVPVVLDWTIANKTCEDPRNLKGYVCKANNSECYNSTNGPGYLCKCPSGFEGNAYIDKPCT
ncbi:hypothetical protein CMV_029166, partial [Castanea mollissima]